MGIYSWIRRILFLLDAEVSHNLSLFVLKWLNHFGLLRLFVRTPKTKPVQVMGLNFPNPVGLAAGLDKNGDYIKALANLGFGFIEIGTVTPRPQPGNPKPRMFRLPQARAIINRMGFNNKGVAHLLKQVKKAGHKGIVGINIGKNFDTPMEKAIDDYLYGLQQVYAYADYISVNISSPNTANLRQLQQGEEFSQLLKGLAEERAALQLQYQRYVPIAVKIAPDLDEEQVKEIAQAIKQSKLDAVIATNTTITRDQVSGLPHANEAGGLSGEPVREMSTKVIRVLQENLDGIPVIGVGGIFSASDAEDKFRAGASLVQLYSGFIYRGPALIKEIVDQHQV
ncbi:MAG: quinone-dependent dihydroorotate dehydrogenase [Gammaproteobacteria bacterium]|nr:quinone-dependent dihydroorotate dehydrogenase [Gammaproteobacteria bacterium]